MIQGKILVVDDEPEIRQLVSDILEDEGYDVVVAEHAAAARAACDAVMPDMVLLDIWMPDVDGITLLKEWCEAGELPFHVVMMSGHGTIETAVEATRLGAYDFLEKPLSMAKLLLTVNRTMQSIRLTRENRRLKQGTPVIGPPMGESPLIKGLKQQAESVAKHYSPVLLKGEIGSGREPLARYIHDLSERRDRPFVTLRIGAIASENYQSAIFGREHEGQVYSGHLEQANGGTLYLDEVAELDAQTQGRLLSTLQASSLLRVDGAEAVPIDVRIIASARNDLEQAVREGTFRDDLYFFLNVLPMTVPPLRDYAADIPGIVLHYTAHLIQRDNLPQRDYSQDALDLLARYQWPGNIRELKNLVRRLLVLAEGEKITAHTIRQLMDVSVQRAPADNEVKLTADMLDLPLKEARESFEREYILYQWQHAGGSVSRLAKNIGMERTHLYRKLKSLGIDHKKQ